MKVINFLFVSAIFLFANSAFAAYSCTGKIDTINQKWDGTISIVSTDIYGDGQGRMICNINADWKGVSPGTCKGWFSKILSIEARTANITVQYNDSNISCMNQPTWSAASKPWAIW